MTLFLLRATASYICKKDETEPYFSICDPHMLALCHSKRIHLSTAPKPHEKHRDYAADGPDGESKHRRPGEIEFYTCTPLLPAHMYRLIVVGNCPSFQLKT